MIFSSLLEFLPLALTLGTLGLVLTGVSDRSRVQLAIGLLSAWLFIFIGLFFLGESSSSYTVPTFLSLKFNKIGLFVGAIMAISLLAGMIPLKNELSLSRSFFYSLVGGVGIIFADNLPTFFIFWTFQRLLPFLGFIKDIKEDRSSGGGTYIIQHALTFVCFGILIFMAHQSGVLYHSFAEIPASFFTWPVLFLCFVIIYQSHGIFPFHSWVHDIVGSLPWYEISAIFLPRAGVLLFVQFVLPVLSTDPGVFKITFLALSIISSIYWSFRGILEENVTKTTTYFYVAQASLILTGLQADLAASRGSYLHMMVISICGTCLWSILGYIQQQFSLKRSNQFYGLAQFYPRMATLFCLFGFCLIGVPLGASFVVEDLVITGLLEQQPYLGLGHILATCLNGILFFQLFTRLFLGQAPYRQDIKNMDLGLKQMAPYLFCLFIMLLIGLWPHIVLEKLTW